MIQDDLFIHNMFIAKQAMNIQLHLRYKVEVQNLLLKLYKYIDLLEVADIDFITKAMNHVEKQLHWDNKHGSSGTTE